MFNSLMPEDYAFDAAVAHHNHVCEISLLYLTSSQLQRLAAAMQEQFLARIGLMLGIDGTYSDQAQVLPDGFSVGPAPRTPQTLMLMLSHSVAFRNLFCPRLTLSTSIFGTFLIPCRPTSKNSP